jgi:hypothetical protein
MMREPSKYSPDRSLDSKWWSAFSEDEQIELVRDYHRRSGVKIPNANLHAATHVIVENQILLGEETPVAATLQRLLGEGLSRHDAVHAIGGVLAPVLVDVLRGEIRSEVNLVYYQELQKLTAESWLSEPS